MKVISLVFDFCFDLKEEERKIKAELGQQGIVLLFIAAPVHRKGCCAAAVRKPLNTSLRQRFLEKEIV